MKLNLTLVFVIPVHESLTKVLTSVNPILIHTELWVFSLKYTYAPSHLYTQ